VEWEKLCTNKTANLLSIKQMENRDQIGSKIRRGCWEEMTNCETFKDTPIVYQIKSVTVQTNIETHPMKLEAHIYIINNQLHERRQRTEINISAYKHLWREKIKSDQQSLGHRRVQTDTVRQALCLILHKLSRNTWMGPGRYCLVYCVEKFSVQPQALGGNSNTCITELNIHFCQHDVTEM
jgi:hypothetical protein